MSGTNMGVISNLKTGGENLSDKRRLPKGYFTYFQASLLLALTLVISVAGWYTAGKYYFWNQLDKKRINDQFMYLQQQVKAQPQNLDLRVALGYTYFLKGENEQAIKELNQVLEIDNNYYDAYYNLGLIYADEERFDDALAMFGKAIKISPRDFKGYLQQGIVYRQLKMYKESFEALDKANSLSPKNADIIYQIGLTAEAKGDKKLAIEIFKEALKYDPLFKEAAKALERVQ